MREVKQSRTRKQHKAKCSKFIFYTSLDSKPVDSIWRIGLAWSHLCAWGICLAADFWSCWINFRIYKGPPEKKERKCSILDKGCWLSARYWWILVLLLNDAINHYIHYFWKLEKVTSVSSTVSIYYQAITHFTKRIYTYSWKSIARMTAFLFLILSFHLPKCVIISEMCVKMW